MKQKVSLLLTLFFILISIANCMPVLDSSTLSPEPTTDTSSPLPVEPTPTSNSTPFLTTSLPTLTPTVIQTSPTFTVMPSPTPIIQTTSHGVLAQFWIVYLWGEVQVATQNEQVIAIDYDPHIIDSRDELPPNPVSSLSFSFSNYSDQIAYWSYEYPSTLWVSDIRLQNSRPAFVDTDGLYAPDGSLDAQDLRLSWSPDDQHLIVYSPNPETPHLIYHLNSGEVEEWYWSCDTVIISSRTGHLALLCPLDLTKEQTSWETYAIIEWKGEIWFTSSLPQEIISQPLPDENKTILWSISPDGQKVAYLDPQDTTYSLLVTDANGYTTSLLPESSILQSDHVGIESPYYYRAPGYSFFHWSSDSQLLALYALDTETTHCRPYIDPYIEDIDTGKSYTVPCWQVVDLTVQKVVWAEKASMETLFLTESEQQKMIIESIDFSPDSQFIVVRGQDFSYPLLAIVSLKSLIAYRLEPLQYARIYWGN